MQVRTGQSYSKCRDQVRQQFPSLFGIEAAPVIANGAQPSARFTRPKPTPSGQDIESHIVAYRVKHPTASYGAARAALRLSNPELFSPKRSPTHQQDTILWQLQNLIPPPSPDAVARMNAVARPDAQSARWRVKD